MIQYLHVSKRHDRISFSDRVENIKSLGEMRKGICSEPNNLFNIKYHIIYQVNIGFIIIRHLKENCDRHLKDIQSVYVWQLL